MPKTLLPVTLQPLTGTKMKKMERQQVARQFISDYMKILANQESMVERIVEKRLAMLEPRIRQMIEQYMEERKKTERMNQR